MIGLLAIWGGTFLDNQQGHFDPLNWLFGAGIGPNVGSSLIPIGLVVGYFWKVRPHIQRVEELHHLAHFGEMHPRAVRRLARRTSVIDTE